MAYNFNGTTQYLSNNSSPLGELPNILTIACFVKGTPAASTGMVTLGNSFSNNSILSLRAETTTSLGFFYRSSTSVTNYNLILNSFFPTTNFKHAAVVLSDSTSILYANGVNSATGSQVGLLSGLFDRFAIGAYLRSNVSGYFGGDIAEVGIWDAALTADEIASLSKGMTCDQIRPQSLVFYAPLVRELSDLKNGLALTNNNGTTVSNHPRVYS